MHRNKIKILLLTVLAFCCFFCCININAMEFYDAEQKERIKEDIFKHYKYEKFDEYCGGYDLIQNHIRDKETGKVLEVKEEDKEQKIPITKKELKILLRGLKDNDPADFRERYNISYGLKYPYPYSRISVDLNLIKEVMEELIEEKKTEEERLKTFYLCFEELFEIFEKNFLDIVRKNNLYKTQVEKNYKEGEKRRKNNAISEDEEKVFSKVGIVRHKIGNDLCNNYDFCENFEDFVHKFFNNVKRWNNGKIENMPQTIRLLRNRVIFDIDTVNSYLGMRITTMLQCLELMDKMYAKFLDFTKHIKDKSLLDLKFAEKISFKKHIGRKEKDIFVKDLYKCCFSAERENCLTYDVKNMEEFFKPNQTAEELAAYLKEILESICWLKQRRGDYSWYLDFINSYKNKNFINSSVVDNIKKGIELRKEIMPVIEKITQKEVYENIVNKIMGFVSEDIKIGNMFN